MSVFQLVNMAGMTLMWKTCFFRFSSNWRFRSCDNAKNVTNCSQNHRHRCLLRESDGYARTGVVPENLHRLLSTRLKLLTNSPTPQLTTEQRRSNLVWTRRRRVANGRRLEKERSNPTSFGFINTQRSICHWNKRVRQSGCVWATTVTGRWRKFNW